MTTETVQATAEETKFLPLPEDLEAWEAEQDEVAEVQGDGYTLPAIEIPGPEHIGRAMKRIGYFDRMMALVSAPFDSEIAERQKDVAFLQEEIRRLESERAAACKPWERRKAWYIGPVEAFMRALNRMDAKVKSWQTPWGVLSLTKRQPVWTYGENSNAEEAAAVLMRSWNDTLVRTKYVIDKAGLKEEAKLGAVVKVENGMVYVRSITQDGEVVWNCLPHVVVEENPPAKFEIKPPKAG